MILLLTRYVITCFFQISAERCVLVDNHKKLLRPNKRLKSCTVGSERLSVLICVELLVPVEEVK